MPRTVLLAVAAIVSGAIAATMAVDEPNDGPAHHHPDVRTLFALYDSDKDGVRCMVSIHALQIRKIISTLSCSSTHASMQHRMMTSRGWPPAHDKRCSPQARLRSLRYFPWSTCLASSLAWACTNHVRFHSLECMTPCLREFHIQPSSTAHRSRVSLLL
jgi:hypothetical protein